MHGPLGKRAPENLLKALRMYSELPREPSEFFWAPHAKKPQTLIVSNVLQCASVTVGHKGVVPSTNFVCKLLTRPVASGESVDSVARSTDDLAKRDARSAAVAWSVLYDVSDMIDGCVTKKSVRAFLSFTKRLPVDFPPDAIGRDEFDHFLANVGKLGVKRPAEEDIADDDLAALTQRGMLARQRRLLREYKRDTADRILKSIERRPGVAKVRNAVVVELGQKDVIVS